VIVAVDSGTTTTRVWVLGETGLFGRHVERAGARDMGSKDPAWLLERIRRLADRALFDGGVTWDAVEAVVAFGMITSELGLEEIPYLPSPVASGDLAAALAERFYPTHLPAPVYLVPGVRVGNGDLFSADVMRGEETEVAGLLALRALEPPLLYVSTGSHSKFVGLDDLGRIAWGLTTLSGELLWALHRETILREIIDPLVARLDLDAVDQGAAAAASAGLSRSLFLARLLNRLRGEGPEACTSFLVGALAETDIAALRAAPGRGDRGARVAIGGGGPFAQAYARLLGGEDWCREVHVVDKPLGAVGARSLYLAKTNSMAAKTGGKTNA
jgi:2-dehydro-3-deoxygalactonokinase